MIVQRAGIKIRGEKKEKKEKSQAGIETKTQINLHMGIPVFLMHRVFCPKFFLYFWKKIFWWVREKNTWAPSYIFFIE